jgi:hypothetical protein
MAAYPNRQNGSFKHVGTFSFARDRFNTRGMICRLSANNDGLLLQPIVPLWHRAAFVPWGEVWLEDAVNPMRPSNKIGFLRANGLTYFVTALFKAKIQKALHGQVPI